MDPNDAVTIEDFVRGMIELGRRVETFSPDYVIAPMMGAIPFIDVLRIVDDDFKNEIVEYMPASNKIRDVKRVIRGWFGKFLEENYIPNREMRVAALDEVVSGNSLVRSYKQIAAAIQDFAFKQAKVESASPQEIASRIRYFPFGVIDQGKRSKKPNVVNKEWEKLAGESKTDSVAVRCIPTMDRPDFFPATYQRIPNDPAGFCYPVVDGFAVSPAYVNFLQKVANIVGKDPHDVTPQNFARILASSHYLPKGFFPEQKL